MLLTLIRSIMIVPLLLSAVCVEANLDKLPFVPSEKEDKAVSQSRRRNDAFARDDVKAVRDQDTELAGGDRLNRYSNRYSADQEARARRASVHGVDNRFPRSGGGGLAHKMAKDALKSPKVQETINKLSHVGSSKGGSRGGGKVGKGKMTGGKGRRSGPGHKGRRKKKRKRHHRRLRKQHPGVQKGGPSKRTVDSKREVSMFPTRSDGGANYMVKRDEVALDDESLDKSSAFGTREKVTAVKVDDSDYVDFSTALYTEPAIHRETLDGSAKLHEKENMIDRLMKTTTNDPSKKKPGDQGVEYSDYYSDDEVLQDIAANKIPVQLVGTSGIPSYRFVRQALNFTSYRDGSPIRRSSRCYRGYDPRRETLGQRDDSVNSLRDFQNYPRIERLPSLRRRSRLTGADDPLQSYPTNDGPSEYQNENSGSPYGVNVDGLPEQSQPLEGSNGLQNNFDMPDINKLDGEVQQTPVDAQHPDQLNYPNQYENSQDDTVNINEAVKPKVPQFQTSNNYQPVDTNFGQAQNFDSNAMNQPRVDMKPQGMQVRTQPSYPSIQLYNNQEGQLGEQVSSNYPLQPKYNVPAINLQNAMDQPLGKILETLGINVNGGSTSPNQNLNLNENINHPVSPYHGVIDHPLEHVISPSYVKKNLPEESSSFLESDNVKGSDSQGVGLRNGNNAKEGYSRRQSIQNAAYNSNLMSHFDNDKSSMHNTNISFAVQDTREVANQILDTIMDELEELKTDRSKNNKKEGSWSTAQAGMKLDMRVANRTIIVTLSDLTSPRFHESLLNGTWNVSGHAPFKRGSPFTLIATDNNTNSMAVFVGACRVCQGVDTIAGVWSVARQPKDCRDFQVSTSVFNDIFRKTKLSSLKEKQGTTTTEETTLKHEKRKS